MRAFLWCVADADADADDNALAYRARPYESSHFYDERLRAADFFVDRFFVDDVFAVFFFVDFFADFFVVVFLADFFADAVPDEPAESDERLISSRRPWTSTGAEAIIQFGEIERERPCQTSR